MSLIKPAKKVVVIEPMQVKTGNTIELVSEKKQETGKIVAIGEGPRPLTMKIGDIVAYRCFGEDKLYLEGKAYLFVTFADILGIIK